MSRTRTDSASQWRTSKTVWIKAPPRVLISKVAPSRSVGSFPGAVGKKDSQSAILPPAPEPPHIGGATGNKPATVSHRLIDLLSLQGLGVSSGGFAILRPITPSSLQRPLVQVGGSKQEGLFGELRRGEGGLTIHSPLDC